MKNFLSTLIFACLILFNPAAKAFDGGWGDTGHIDTESKNPNELQLAKDPCGRDGEGHGVSSGSEQGSPIELYRGNLVWHDTDLSIDGRFSLTLERTFDSEEMSRGMFGRGWVGNCERTLVKTLDYGSDEGVTGQDGNTIRYLLRLANGKRFMFGDKDSPTKRPDGVWADLTESGNETVLSWKSGRKDTYVDGVLTQETDPYGNYVRYSYQDGRLVKMETNDGRSISFEYDSARQVVTAARDNTGRYCRYYYNSETQLIRVENPSGSRLYEYLPSDTVSGVAGVFDLVSFLTKVTDESGVVELTVDYVMDSFADFGRVDSYNDGLTRYDYQYVRTVEGTFSSRISEVIKTGDGKSWRYYLSKTGQIEKKVSPEGTITYSRNKDYQSEITNVPTGYTITTVYDSKGRPTSISNQRGTTSYGYAGDFVTPTKISLPDNLGTFYYSLDGKGSVVKITDPKNNEYILMRNGLGDITRITLPGGDKYWDYTYNSHGLLETATSPAGLTERFVRNDRGFVTNYFDPTQREWITTYDPVGRKLTETTPEQVVTTYEYNGTGKITKVIADNLEEFVYRYDGAGRLESTTNFWGAPTVYTYEPNSYRVATITDPKQNITYYGYNGNGKLIRKSTSDQTIDYTYDSNGRQDSAANTVASVSYKYNPYNEVVQEIVSGNTFTYDYDALGRLAQSTLFGTTFVRQYNPLGLIERLITPAGDFVYGYDNKGRLTSLARPNSVNTTYDYDDSDRLESIQHGTLGQLDYEFDDGSRIASITGLGNVVTYDYDDDNHLTGASYAPPLADSTAVESFAYDSLGNRTDSGAQYLPGNRLQQDSQFNYEYDANGNRTRRINRSTGAYELYTYSNWNQLIRYRRYVSASASTPSEDVQYAYGPEGQRFRKIRAGVTTNYVWSGSNLISEQTGSNIRRYFGELVVDNGSYLYPLNDHIATTRMIANGSGSLVWSGVSKAFGVVSVNSSQITWNLRFPGQYYDQESGLHYNYHRSYDPSIGRYLQSDPIELAGGVNTYGYVRANPVSSVDLYGLFQCDAIKDKYPNAYARLMSADRRVTPKMIKAYKDLFGLTDAKIMEMFAPGKGPKIEVGSFTEYPAQYLRGKGVIEVSPRLLAEYESGKSSKTWFDITIQHEGAHYLDYKYNGDKYQYKEGGDVEQEEGWEYEKRVRGSTYWEW